MTLFQFGCLLVRNILEKATLWNFHIAKRVGTKHTRKDNPLELGDDVILRAKPTRYDKPLDPQRITAVQNNICIEDPCAVLWREEKKVATISYPRWITDITLFQFGCLSVQNVLDMATLWNLAIGELVDRLFKTY